MQPRLINCTSSDPLFSGASISILHSFQCIVLFHFTEAALTPDLIFSYLDYFKKFLSGCYFPSLTSLSTPTSAKSIFCIAVSSSSWKRKSHAITVSAKVFPLVLPWRSNSLDWHEKRAAGWRMPVYCLFSGSFLQSNCSKIIIFSWLYAHSIQLWILPLCVLHYPLASSCTFSCLMSSGHSPTSSDVASLWKPSPAFPVWIWVCLFADVSTWEIIQHDAVQWTLMITISLSASSHSQ